MADCHHMWEVSGDHIPIVRCGRCNTTWCCFNQISNLPPGGYFSILQDCFLRYFETQDPLYLQQARAIWDCDR